MEVYGNPPYGHAELSPLKKFCGFLGFDAKEALAALHKAGYDASITLETEIREIARIKGVSPQQVYNDIRTALVNDPFAAMPPSPPEGIGKLTLKDICKSYGLPVDEAIARLEKKSIHAKAAMTMRDIGRKNSINPHEVYSTLRAE